MVEYRKTCLLKCVSLIHCAIISTVTPKVSKIVGGSIDLPKSLRKAWKGAVICIAGGKDTLIIKKLHEPSLKDMRPTLKSLGKKISKKDVDSAIRSVRSKKNR